MLIARPLEGGLTRAPDTRVSSPVRAQLTQQSHRLPNGAGVKAPEIDRQARLRAMIDKHRRFVLRTLWNAGVPRSHLDDEAQRTFIAAASRLDDVQPGAERAFLF